MPGRRTSTLPARWDVAAGCPVARTRRSPSDRDGVWGGRPTTALIPSHRQTYTSHRPGTVGDHRGGISGVAYVANRSPANRRAGVRDRLQHLAAAPGPGPGGPPSPHRRRTCATLDGAGQPDHTAFSRHLCAFLGTADSAVRTVSSVPHRVPPGRGDRRAPARPSTPGGGTLSRPYCLWPADRCFHRCLRRCLAP